MILSLLVLQWLVFPTVSISIFRSWYLLIFSSSFSSILPSPGIATSIIHARFFSTTVMSGMLCARCLSVCILKSQRILTSSFCRTLSTFYSHLLSAVGRLCFLQRFQCSIDATLSCRSLKSVCAILLQKLTKWSIVSSFTLHNRHLLSLEVLSILALMALILIAWSCAALMNPSVSFFR